MEQLSEYKNPDKSKDLPGKKRWFEVLLLLRKNYYLNVSGNLSLHNDNIEGILK
jgi:hypothetical protein